MPLTMIAVGPQIRAFLRELAHRKQRATVSIRLLRQAELTGQQRPPGSTLKRRIPCFGKSFDAENLSSLGVAPASVRRTHAKLALAQLEGGTG